MNIFDIVVGVIAILFLFKGLKRGFFIELAGFVALFLGLWISYSYYEFMSVQYISQYLDWSEESLQIFSFFILFVIVVTLVHLLAKLITGFLKIIALGLVNRLFGGLFGLMKLLLLLIVFYLSLDYIDTFYSLKSEDWLEDSLVFQNTFGLYQNYFPALAELFEEHTRNI
ncbi:MAG: CvpA family protein [Psychroflexus halocasei]|uniref:CvpA family protein n=1 Tax=Psychroflexus sp. S27 TaxID=1982757 RepID=UPI000C2A1E46|nr:CvpA family protein [Psychroflexus sp. S27]PJX21697.1 hypothetical protein CAP47_08690 [Psychroflexus sp. S27]